MIGGENGNWGAQPANQIAKREQEGRAAWARGFHSGPLPRGLVGAGSREEQPIGQRGVVGAANQSTLVLFSVNSCVPGSVSVVSRGLTWGARDGRQRSAPWGRLRAAPGEVPGAGRGAGGDSRLGAAPPELPLSLLLRHHSPCASGPSSGSSYEPILCSRAAPEPRHEGGKPAPGASPVAPAEGAGSAGCELRC